MEDPNILEHMGGAGVEDAGATLWPGFPGMKRTRISSEQHHLQSNFTRLFRYARIPTMYPVYPGLGFMGRGAISPQLRFGGCTHMRRTSASKLYKRNRQTTGRCTNGIAQDNIVKARLIGYSTARITAFVNIHEAAMIWHRYTQEELLAIGRAVGIINTTCQIQYLRF